MRIVIKVGSSTITRPNGKLNLSLIDKYARVLTDIHDAGNDVILVTSGAQVVGTAKLNLKSRPKATEYRQAVAAVGQCELMSIYDKAFNEYGTRVAQVLLTKDVVDNRERKKNLVNTFKALIKYNCIPIINENDSVEVDEIKFGDNDTLSALVASTLKADKLVMMTDIDGLFDSDPHLNPSAKRIDTVAVIDEKIRNLAGETSSSKGTGGMITKISAAEIATKNGIDAYITNGSNPEKLYDILNGENVGTHFLAH